MPAKTAPRLLQDTTIANLKPDTVVHDAIVPGLSVRARAQRKTFIVRLGRAGGRLVLGHYLAKAPVPPAGAFGPDVPLTLDAARDVARAALAKLGAKLDPVRKRDEDAQKRRDDEARLRRDTVAAAIGKFLEDEATRKLRSQRETEAILRREFLGQTWERVERDGGTVTNWTDGPDPIWRDRPVIEIARRDVIERLDSIKRRGGKHAARHALAAVRKFFNWCAEGERFGVEVSPCAKVRDKTIGIKGSDLKRQHVLLDAELRNAWRAAVAVGYPFGSVVQLLALTGQRLNDIARARWSEIDLDKAVLTVPPERFKTNAAQLVPLSPLAVEIIGKLPRFAGPYVFTTTAGRRPISGVSKMKAALDGKIGEPMRPWVLHDVRRSVRTRLVSDVGVDAFIAERVIGHALPGLHAVYDQGTHAVQKRAALDRWAEALAVIVGLKPPPGEGKKPAKRKAAPRIKKANVVRLDEHRRRA